MSKFNNQTIFSDAIQSANAFLVSQLEKLDAKLYDPLVRISYAQDVPMRTGGGWNDVLSYEELDFGITEGNEGPISNAGTNAIPIIQSKLNKIIVGTHAYEVVMRHNWIDVQRAQLAGRPIEERDSRSLRTNYQTHLDQDCYMGFPRYNTRGLFNYPGVYATTVDASGIDPVTAAASTLWKNKTPADIIVDISTAISEVWGASGYDDRAMPNHVLIPMGLFNFLASTQASGIAQMSLLSYILANNPTTQNTGEPLVIRGVKWAAGAGVGGTDRMLVYRMDDDIMYKYEMVPLGRRQTAPLASGVFESYYNANIADLVVVYLSTMGYFDGI